MSTNTLSEHQRQKLESVRSLLRGKSLVLQGGNWTAEAREPKRKQLLLKQLTLAGQFRQTMENTANSANQEGSTVEQVTKSLLDQTSQMHQLTALTQAVQRRQVQEASSYNDYDKWAKEDRQLRNKKVEAATLIIRDQCERLADPKKERPSRIPIIEHAEEQDEPLPAAEEPPQVPLVHVQEEAMKPAAVSLPPTPRRPTPPTTATTTTTTTVASPPLPPGPKTEKPKDNFEVSRPQRNSRFSLPMTRPVKTAIESPSPMKKKSKRKKPNDVAIPPPEAMIRPDNTPSCSPSYSPPAVATAGSVPVSGKKRKSSPPQRRSEPDYTAAANSPASIATGDDARPDEIVSGVATHNHNTSRPMSRRERRSQGPKKCHNCKTLQTEFLKCKFFLVTGNRCGKYYCSECLKDDYGEDVDLSAANDDWHCPACLGNCRCAPCEREREREARRELLLARGGGSHRAKRAKFSPTFFS